VVRFELARHDEPQPQRIHQRHRVARALLHR
jgi:hypothetical protein